MILKFERGFYMFDENISILIPYKPDGGQRDINWSWIKKRYELLLPNAELCMGDSDIIPYCRSAAVNNAARQATRDFFIIADADIVFDKWQIEKAYNMLSKHAWVFPFVDTDLLNEEQTNGVLGRESNIKMSDIEFKDCQKYYYSLSQIFLIPRKYFEKVKGFDEAFKGWGWEDQAFCKAVNVICGENARIQDSTVWHLHHPPAYGPQYKANFDIFCEWYKDEESIRKWRGIPKN